MSWSVKGCVWGTSLKLSKTEMCNKLPPATLTQADMAVAQALRALGHDTDDVTSVRALAAASVPTSAQQSGQEMTVAAEPTLRKGDTRRSGLAKWTAGDSDKQRALPQQGPAEACNFPSARPARCLRPPAAT